MKVASFFYSDCQKDASLNIVGLNCSVTLELKCLIISSLNLQVFR
jgi:hypothetical protein